MTPQEFDKLEPNKKWKNHKDQEGPWFCRFCSEQDGNTPHRSSPFHGCEIVCGNCDQVLTARTGGGQHDPFNWVLCLENADEEEESKVYIVFGRFGSGPRNIIGVFKSKEEAEQFGVKLYKTTDVEEHKVL